MTRNEPTRDDDEPYVVIADRSSDLGPFLFGAALGAVIALLLAPRSGAETRHAVRQRLRSAQRSARDAAEGVASTFTQAREELERRIESARAAVSSRSRQLGDAVTAGRSAARDAERDVRSRMEKASSNPAAPAPRRTEKDTEAGAADATPDGPSPEQRRAPRGGR